MNNKILLGVNGCVYECTHEVTEHNPFMLVSQTKNNSTRD